ncbi:MAG: TonB-dependent receptor [Proteobacteria bacterium]|nr:TonB-dependent receptor [Pseudomonadota bacterium]
MRASTVTTPLAGPDRNRGVSFTVFGCLLALVPTPPLSAQDAAPLQEQPPAAPEPFPAPAVEEERAQQLRDSDPVATESVGVEELDAVLDSDRGAPAELDDDLLRLDTISILGASEEIPSIAGSAHVIGAEELEVYERDDIHRVLARAPGVYVRGEDGFGLRPNIGIRGANSERSAKVTLLEDGVMLAPAPYSAPAAYYFPLVTRVTRVEVFKGPASIRHGPNTIGGAVNLGTRAVPETSSGAIDAALGSFGYGKLHGHHGLRCGPFALLLEAAHLQSGGFKKLDGPGNTGFDKNELMLKSRYRSGSRSGLLHQIELKLGFGDERSHETYLGLTDSDFQADPLRRYAASALGLMDWWRTQAQASYLIGVGDGFELRATAYRHDFRRAWRKLVGFDSGAPPLADVLANPDSGRTAVYYRVLTGQGDSLHPSETLLIGNNDRRFVSQGLQFRGRWSGELGSLVHRLQFGARIHQDSVRRDQTARPYSMRDAQLARVTAEPPRVLRRDRAATTAVALYLHETLELASLSLAPGVRVELIDTELGGDAGPDRLPVARQRSDAVVLPGLGVHYQVLPELGVLAGLHRGFSPAAPGQPEVVEHETAINYELGARVLVGQSRLELMGFASDYRNLTATCTASAGCRPEAVGVQYNAGSVVAYGLELGAAQGLDAGDSVAVNVELNYTLTLSRFRTSFSSPYPQFGEVERGDELPYVPRHQGLLALELHGAGWNASLVGRHASRMRDTAGQGSAASAVLTDARWLLDLALGADLWQGAQAYLTINNALDHRYIASRRPFGARPGRPLQLLLGLKQAFGP